MIKGLLPAGLFKWLKMVPVDLEIKIE